FGPLLTQFLSDIRQRETPRQRSGERVDHEACEIHSRDTRWKRNERSNRGQQTAHKNDYFTILRKPAIGDVEIVTRKQNVFSVLLNERPPTVHPNPVRDQRPQLSSPRPRDPDSPKIHFAATHQIPRERHDDLGRQRYARRLD